MTISYLGIGSNLCEPHKQVQLALTELKTLPNSDIIKHSNFYVSKALLPEERPNEIQNDYVNVVVKISTNLTPLELLTATQSIENKMGRKRSNKRWEARIIDIDILTYGNIEMQTEKLTIPHPEMLKRDFVMKPLMEIEPEITIPRSKRIHE